ncbi:dienelactone hydrolase family protein [Duganella sp. S19_KUP01_CR8]|uniref:carboxylesterase family protein n=1 Tax=Duganella sp. S19_KUP01_CR8 TaxID=3025502 RepID=UPI002FCDD7FC
MSLRAAFISLLLTASCASASQPELVTDRSTPAHQAADAAMLKSLDRDVFFNGAYAGPTGTLGYRLMSPPAPQPGKLYPLIIVLHGSGAVGNDNSSQLGALAMSWSAPAIRKRYPAYILVPQFAERSANYAPSATDGLLAAKPGPNLLTLRALVETLKPQFAIDPDRIYVTGFSMGASAATQAVLQDQNEYAAAVAFSGIAPDRAAAAQLKDLPLLLVHGDADTENSIEPDRALFAALQRQPGGAKARMLEYRGMEHTVPPDMLLATAWRDWLFAQHKR